MATATLDRGSKNKENVSMGICGILASLNTNTNTINGCGSSSVSASISSSPAPAGSSSSNESFDTDKCRFDVYEKSIQKLSDENKSLRKRVTKLTELARAKEEQLLAAFAEACDDKRRNEERAKLEHDAQLQSYFECFLHIEKENASLRAKLDQMRTESASQQRQLTLLLQQQATTTSQAQQQQPIQEEPSADETDAMQVEVAFAHPVTRVASNDELSRMSMQHIDREMAEHNKCMDTFIQESKLMSATRQASTCTLLISETTTTTTTTREDVAEDSAAGSTEIALQHQQQQLALANERIGELELEKSALEKKVASIESSLARWIFRACDYKSDLGKASDECARVEARCGELDAERQRLQSSLAHVHELSVKSEARSSRLGERVSELDAEVRRLNDELAGLTNINVKLTTTIEQFAALQATSKSQQLDHDQEQERRNTPSVAVETSSVGVWAQPELVHAETQTHSQAQAQAPHHDAPPPVKMLVSNKSTGTVVAQTVAKLTQMLASGATSSALVEQTPQQQQQQQVASVDLATPSQLAALKAKLDACTLERNAFKCKNDEMSRECERLSSEVSRLSTAIGKYQQQQQQQQKPATQVSVAKATSQRGTQTTAVNVRCVSTGTQTTTTTTSVNVTASTLSSSSTTTTAACHISSSIDRSMDEWRRELETERARWSKERAEAAERYEDKCGELIKCELACLNERSQCVRMQAEASELHEKLKALGAERDALKSQLAKLQDAYRIEKQVSNTIIQQQKKLLDYLQVQDTTFSTSTTILTYQVLAYIDKCLKHSFGV